MSVIGRVTVSARARIKGWVGLGHLVGLDQGAGECCAGGGHAAYEDMRAGMGIYGKGRQEVTLCHHRVHIQCMSG